MAKSVYVPQAGGIIDFPDEATPQQMLSYIESTYGAATTAAPTPEPTTGPDESGILGRFAYGFGTGLTDIPGGIASLLYPAEQAAQTTAGQFSGGARKYLEETLGIDPTKEPTAVQQAAGALGSVASFLVPGSAVAKGAGLLGKTAAVAGRLGTATASAQGVALGAEQRAETIRQQLASGMKISEEEQLAAQRLSGLIDASEAMPVSKFFGPLTQILSKVPISQAPALNKIVQSRLGRVTRAGLEEGAQEAAAGIANDIMEYGIYNPNVQIGQDVLSNAGTGAFAGSFVEGLIQLAAGRKLRPFKQLEADLLNESRQNTEKVRLGQIAQAAENLRQTGVEGTVDVEQDEFDGLPVFNIKAPGGDVIARFDDQDGRAEDNAIAAVNLYAKNTGVKVEPNIIKREPEVSSETDIPEDPSDFDTEIKEPPKKPGTVRVYHSGERGEGETSRWASTSRTYASDYRKDLPLFYTDLPATDPRVNPDPLNAEQTVEQGFTFNFELNPEEAVSLRRIKRNEAIEPEVAPAVPSEAPIGMAEATAPIEETAAPEAVAIAEPVAEQPIEPTIPEQEAGVTAKDVTPKSLHEAYAMGPRVKAPTEEVLQKFKKIYNDLASRVSAIAPPDVTVGLREFIDTAGPGVLVKGQHNKDSSGGQTKNVIDLATGIYDPGMTTDELLRNLLDVLNHEVIHALRGNGLIRPSEWRILSRAVAEANVPGKKYTYLDKAQAVYNESMSSAYADPDAVIEEAVAELYKDWVRNGKAPIQTRGLLNRITEFFRRIFRTLRDNKYEEVFQAIESGEVRGREPVAAAAAGTRFSAAPVDRAALLERRKAILAEARPLAEKGSLTGSEAKRLMKLGNDLSEVMYDLQRTKSLDPAKVKSEAERMSTLPVDIVVQAYNDALKDRDVFIAISNAAMGTQNDALTDVDLLFEGPKASVMYEAFSPTRKALRERFGDTMRLYRAEGKQRQKPTQNWATTREYAKQFGNKITEREIPVDNILAVNVGTGNYHELIVGNPPSETGPRFSAAPALNTEEFKRWFKKSGVVDKQGRPMVVYHHGYFTEDGNFVPRTPMHFGTMEAAKERAFGKRTDDAIRAVMAYKNEDGVWHWDDGQGYTSEDAGESGYASEKDAIKAGHTNVASREDYSEEEPEDLGTIVPAYLSLQKMKRVPDVGGANGEWDVEIEKAKAEGYDGIVYKNLYEDKGSDSYIAFYPEQVKSTDSKFSTESADIRFSATPLPTYIQSQNQNLFTEPPKLSFSEIVFDYLFGFKPRSREHMRTAIRANIVDKTAAVTLLEQKANLQDTGSLQRRVADYSATWALTQRRRASHLTASSIMMGPPKINYDQQGNILSATIKMEESPDSLLKVFEVMMQPGPVNPVTGKASDLREVFKTYAIAIRGRDFRAKGKAVPREITPQYVNEALSFIPREYPQVVEAYNMYQRYNKQLLTAARDAGIISTAELGRLTQDMNYYGFYREVFQEELVPTSTTKTAGEFKLREYKGSEEGGLINDPMYVMIRNTQFWMESIAKNLASIKSYDVARCMGEAQLLGQGQSPDLSQGFQKDIMYFKENGVLKRFAVKDPLLVTALGSDDRVNLGKAIDLLGMPASLLRETVTRDPAFMVANLLRDTVSSWITSGENIIPFIGTAKGVVSSLKQSASFKDLMGRGIVGAHDIAMMEPAQIASTIRRKAMPKNIHTIASADGAIGALRDLWDLAGRVSEASDAATRIAVYDAARAQGMSEAEAAMRAGEIMDFSRRGASTLLGILTKTVPFLNARIQGLDVLYQSAAAGKRFIMGQSVGERDANLGKQFLVRGLILAAISTFLEGWNEDDEDYKQLDSYIKDSNLLIPLKVFGLPGQFIAIPKPFEAGLLFSTFPQMLYKYFVSETATNRDAAKLFFDQFASTFGINPLPQILIPPLEVIMNHDLYTGLPLIPEGKMRLDPSLQYDSRTSTLARMINGIPIVYDFNTGEFRGPSPISVDNLINGYTGPVGSYIVMGLGALMSMYDAGPEKIPMEISNYPVVRRFFVDAEAKNPAVVTQAYELFRIVDEANRTFSRLRQSNDAEALLDYYEKKKDVLAYKKYIMKLVDRLNKISAYERQIERDKTMTDQEKIEAMRRVRDLRIRVASKVGEINKALGR